MAIPREDLIKITLIFSRLKIAQKYLIFMNNIFKLSDIEKAYIAGFLDGDGSINAQIVRRSDYILKFQIRVSVTFFQKTKHHWFLLQLKDQLKYGTIRKRNDGMSEYSIIGIDSVKNILYQLEPFVKIKKPQLKILLEIIEKLPTSKDPQTFIALCERVDHLGQHNYSKKRIITTQTVRSELEI